MVVAARVVVVEVVEDFEGRWWSLRANHHGRATGFDSFERKLDQRELKNSARIRHSQRGGERGKRPWLVVVARIVVINGEEVVIRMGLAIIGRGRC